MKTISLVAGLFVSLFIGFIAMGQELDHLNPDNQSFEIEEQQYHYQAPDDSTTIDLKTFKSEKLPELRDDTDLNYKKPPSMAESLWQRFLMWLSQFLGRLFETATSTDWGRVFVYAAALVGFIFIVLMILKVNAFRIFYSGADSGSVSTKGLHENIHEMNFESLLQDALRQQRYRDGVRLLFLHALKILTDQHHIDWQPGKTNHDYVNELAKGELKNRLNELSFYFDYAWYGNFSVNESTFRKTETLFNDLKQKISA